MIVVASEGTGIDVVWIFPHGANPFQIEGLPIQDIFNQSFLQHVDHVLVATSPGKTRFDASFAHNVAKVLADSQRRAARAGLE